MRVPSPWHLPCCLPGDFLLQCGWGSSHKELKDSTQIHGLTWVHVLQPAIAVRFCPLLFELEKTQTDTPGWPTDLPYRMIFAIATRDSILIFDTQVINLMNRWPAVFHFAHLPYASAFNSLAASLACNQAWTRLLPQHSLAYHIMSFLSMLYGKAESVFVPVLAANGHQDTRTNRSASVMIAERHSAGCARGPPPGSHHRSGMVARRPHTSHLII